jgi:rubrerythrin
MSDQPSYLDLLNAVARGEHNAHCYLTEWANVTVDPEVRKILLTVAAREGEHAASFAKRINELGFEPVDAEDTQLPKTLDLMRSDCSDLEKMEALQLDKLTNADGTDIFDTFFNDHTIDIRTGELLGRYIAEEHDSLRLLQGCHNCLRDAATAEAASTPTQATRAVTRQLTSLEGKVDTITRAVEDLRQVVCAQAMPVG